MTVLTFPSNPTEGQIYDAPNGIQYVYDGVKWAGETTTSSSVAVTGATQDRVAPMFVNGNNNGITFTYDDVTNTMTATVTSTVGDTLSNNSHEFTLESDGTLTLDGEPFAIPDVSNFITSSALTGYATENYVTTRGYITSNGLPSQTNNSGKYLTTDGTTLSWGTVASGTTDSLTNGSNQVVLEADGSITFPTLTTTNWNDNENDVSGPTLKLGNDPTSQVVITGPTPNSDNASAQRLVIQGQQGYGGENNTKGEGGDVYIWAGSGGDGGAIDPRGNGGDVKLRGGLGGNEGGYIRIESGDAQADSGYGGFLDLNAGNAGATGGTGGNVNINAGGGNALGGNVNINAGQGDTNTGGTINISGGYGSVTGGNVEIVAGGGTTSGNVSVSTGNGGWVFKQDGSFSLNYDEVHIATNNWGIGVGGGTGATGVVYTAKNSDLSSIRVHATIEGDEDGDATGFHIQACDMMIVRRISNTNVNTVDSVVYGVIYTGAGPLASLDAQWNSVSNKIEITATPTSTTNNVYVKIYATEVARGD
jgi:hypothetical protein